MITIQRTDSSNVDFRQLVLLLDDELSVRDGEEHPFYAQFNKLDAIRHVIVAYAGNIAVGCGAFRQYAPGIAEIKRMFVEAGHRGQGIASYVLASLEEWAAQENFEKCILETGYNQPEAIALYLKAQYRPIPNYGPYEAAANSICMEKSLTRI
jgi:GNAT superfamily N-acetyltransferase